MKTEEDIVNSHPEFRIHIQKAKDAGFCEQCQYPWHDGFCECNNVIYPKGFEKKCEELIGLFFSLKIKDYKQSK